MFIGLMKEKTYEKRTRKREQDFTQKRKMAFVELIPNSARNYPA
jgi:hypothetical protein